MKIVITLGNRDVQLRKTATIPLEHGNWFVRNNDSEDWIINSQENKSFFDITRDLFEKHYERYHPHLIFPMIEKTLEHASTKPEETEIIFVASAQDPPDRQDCKYVGEIAKKYLEDKGYQCRLETFSFPPTETGELINFFFKFYYEPFNLPEQSIISTSGGTPDMRAAAFLTALFKNMRVITINARTGEVSEHAFRHHENRILQEIVNNMLSVYDYEGIRKLPVKQNIKDLCEEALKHYNLENGIDEQDEKDEKDEKAEYDVRAARAIDLLIDNAHICFTQGRYAETIGRLFRIEEAIWYLLLYLTIKQKNLIKNGKVIWTSNSKEKKEKFERLISREDFKKDFFKTHFPDLFEEVEGKLKLKNTNDVTTQSGKNFYYHFFKSLNLYSKVGDFLKIINRDERGGYYSSESLINQLRNQSYLGHGFKGITKKQVVKVCCEHCDSSDNCDCCDRFDLKNFLNQLREVFKQEGIPVPQNDLFEKYNEKIKHEMKNS